MHSHDSKEPAEPGGEDSGPRHSNHALRTHAPHSHHPHGPGAGAHGDDAGTGRLIAGILLNLGITVAEAVAGFLSGSLALLADAAHNLNDTASLGITLVARKIAGRDPDESRTFGYRRAEVIGAFVNLVTLVLIAVYLLVEAVERALDPRPIDGRLMMIVAGIALVGNVATAWMLHRPSKDSLNVEAAYVHIVADALASVAVLGAGGLVMAFGWMWVDPLMTGLISIYILWQSARMLRRTVDILMMTAPTDLDFDAMVAAMEAVDAVAEVHHVHVWRLDEHTTALEAHVVVEERSFDTAERVKRATKDRLCTDFAIGHATLEVEHGPCADTGATEPGETAPGESSQPRPPVIASDC